MIYYKMQANLQEMLNDMLFLAKKYNQWCDNPVANATVMVVQRERKKYHDITAVVPFIYARKSVSVLLGSLSRPEKGTL